VCYSVDVNVEHISHGLTSHDSSMWYLWKKLFHCLLQNDGAKSSQAPVQTSKGTTTTANQGTTTTAGKQKESKDVVLSRLMKLDPKELMNEIVNGHVPLSLLNQVANRLPAEMLQQAVDFLSKTDSSSDAESSSLSEPGE